MDKKTAAMPIAKRMCIVHQLHPKTAALLGYLTGEKLTTTYLTAHAVTSDNFVMVGTSEDPFLNCLFGEVDYLREKVRDVADFALQHSTITPDEHQNLLDLFAAKIG